MKDSGLKAALLIATYNWPEALNLVLLSVLQQSRMPDEILIADDGSGQDTAALIDSYKSKFKVPLIHVWQPDDGFRKTIVLNKAIAKSSSAYIIQIDGDVVLNRHFIADHIKSAEHNIFIRGTRALLTPHKTTTLINSNNIDVTAYARGVIHRNNALRMPLLRFLGTRKVASSRSVRGSNLSYWKTDFIKVNGYNNEMNGWGHEDEELATRFINAGLKKKIIKLYAVQYHLHHQISSSNSEPEQRRLVDQTRQQHIAYCANGYQQVIS
jgi:glycosyltransferase involved in cell wall biosynthesis